MKLTHIDHNFYRLTAAQAKSLCLTGQLPKHGYEGKADPAKLARVELVKVNPHHGYTNLVPCEGQPKDYGQAWITRTKLSWWNGKAPG